MEFLSDTTFIYITLAAVFGIFMAWGIAAGLTFWASMLKGVKMLAQKNEQGKFFGILDGGR